MFQVDTVKEAEDTLEQLILKAIQSNSRMVTLWLRGVTLQNPRAYAISILLTAMILFSYKLVPNTLGSMALSGIYYIILRTNWSQGNLILKLIGVTDEVQPTAEDIRIQHILASTVSRRLGKYFKRIVDAYRAYNKFGLSTNIWEVYPIIILLGSLLIASSFMSIYGMFFVTVIITYLWGPVMLLLRRGDHSSHRHR